MDYLGRSVEEIPSPTCINLLDCVLSALQQNCANDIGLAVHLRKRLPLLFTLLDVLQDRPALDDLIAAAVGGSLPLYSQSLPPMDDASDSTPLASMVRASESQWRHIRACLPDNKVIQHFLGRETWTRSTVNILCAFSYERAIPQETFAAWLGTEKCQKRSLEEYLVVLASVLDKMQADGEEISESHIDTYVSSFRPLVQTVLDADSSFHCRSTAARCAALMIELIPAKLADLLSQISDLVESSDTRALTPDIFSLASKIHEMASTAAKRIITALVEPGMQYLVRQLSDDDYLSGPTKTIVERLCKSVNAMYIMK